MHGFTAALSYAGRYRARSGSRGTRTRARITSPHCGQDEERGAGSLLPAAAASKMLWNKNTAAKKPTNVGAEQERAQLIKRPARLEQRSRCPKRRTSRYATHLRLVRRHPPLRRRFNSTSSTSTGRRNGVSGDARRKTLRRNDPCTFWPFGSNDRKKRRIALNDEVNQRDLDWHKREREIQHHAQNRQCSTE